MLNKNGIYYIKSGSDDFEVIFLTRKEGFSKKPYDSLNMSYNCGDDKENVDKNYKRFFEAFGIARKRFVKLNQVHGDDILVIRQNDKERKMKGDYDAVITNETTLCLSIATADCLPVFLFDEEKKVFAAVHAGWKGTALAISKKVVNIMKKEFMCDAADIKAVLGPAIKECCYEIGADVLEKLLDSVVKKEKGLYRESNGKIYANLGRFNVAQLKEAGVKDENVSIVDSCTCCERELFFSYRRENKTGRQLGFIRKSTY